MIKKIAIGLAICLNFMQANASNDIEFTVMHGPGGVSDIVTRFIAKELPDKNNYRIENRPGAAGKIAIKHLLDTPSMMLATMVQVYATNPLQSTEQIYDPQKDLEILATVGVMPSALICHKNTGIKDFDSFQKVNKTLTFGVGGFGSSEHISTEVLLSKFNNKHKSIPYAQGGSTAIKDLLGGHIDCMFGNFPTIRNHISSPNLTLIMTSHKMIDSVVAWEEVFKEKFPFQSYLSIVASAKLDKSIKDKIRRDLNIAFTKTNFEKELTSLGLFPFYSIENSQIEKAVSDIRETQKFIISNKIKISG